MPKKHVLEIYSHTPTHCIGCVDVSEQEAERDAAAAGGGGGTVPTYAGARGGAPRDRKSLTLPWAALRLSLALGVRRDVDGKLIDYRIDVTLLHRARGAATVVLRDARTDARLEEFGVTLDEGRTVALKGSLPFTGATDFTAEAFLDDAPDVTARDDAFIHVPKTLVTADAGAVELLFAISDYEEHLDDLVVVTSERLGTWSRWVSKHGTADGDFRTFVLPVEPGERCKVEIVPLDAGAGYTLVDGAAFPEDWFDARTPRRIFRGYHRGATNSRGTPLGRSFLHLAPRPGDEVQPFALHVFLFCKFKQDCKTLPAGMGFEEWKALLRWEVEHVWSRQHELVGLEGSVEGKRVLVDVHVPSREDRRPRDHAWWDVWVDDRKELDSKTDIKGGHMLLDAKDVLYKGDERGSGPTTGELRRHEKIRRAAFLVGAHEMGHGLGLPDEYGWRQIFTTRGGHDLHVPGAPHAWEGSLMASASNVVARRHYWPWAAWLHRATRWRWGVGSEAAGAYAYESGDANAPFRPDGKPLLVSSTGKPSARRWARFRIHEYTIPDAAGGASAYEKIRCLEARLRVTSRGAPIEKLEEDIYPNIDPYGLVVVECTGPGERLSLLVFDVHVKVGGAVEEGEVEVPIVPATGAEEALEDFGLKPPEHVRVPRSLAADLGLAGLIWHIAGHAFGIPHEPGAEDCALVPATFRPRLRDKGSVFPVMRIPMSTSVHVADAEALAAADGIRGLLEAESFRVLALRHPRLEYTDALR